MQPVSEAYRAEQRRRVAGQALGRVVFSLVEPEAGASAQFSAPQESTLSACGAMLAARAAQKTYASFEAGRFTVGALQRCVPDDAAAYLPEGYISNAVCGQDGAFAAPPVLRLTLPAPATLPGLTLLFDAVCGDWAAQVTLTAFCGGTMLWRRVCSPAAPHFVLEQPLGPLDTLEFTFTRMSQGNRRVRVQQMLLGRQLVFEANRLKSLALQSEVDPLCRRLPTGSVRFSVVDRNAFAPAGGAVCDPDAPGGEGQYAALRCPVEVQFGQRLTGASTVEWVNGGRYYLTAQPQAEGLFVSFAAQDTLSLMTDTYYKGVYAPNGQSLYALAEAVLVDAKLPALLPGAKPWLLWQGLRTLKTCAPLPVKTHRECLQLLAHAAGCALWCARDSTVCILPLDEAQAGTALTFDALLDEPRSTQNAALAAVHCAVQSFSQKAERTRLHLGSYTVQGAAQLHISHSAAADVLCTVEGAAVQLVSCTPYAAATDIVLSGSGEARVELTGCLLEQSAFAVTATVENAAPHAASENVENPMLTDVAQAQAVAERTRDHLCARTSYTVQTMGAPELEPLDCLLLETRYNAQMPVRVIRAETTLDGSLRTNLTLKRRQSNGLDNP